MMTGCIIFWHSIRNSGPPFAMKQRAARCFAYGRAPRQRELAGRKECGKPDGFP
jgi:hypothetical protein